MAFMQDRAQPNKPWAKSAIGDEADVVLEALQKGLTVDLIATKRAKFETCAVDEMVFRVVERNRHNQFDFLPVVQPATGRIVGLIEIARFMRGATPNEPISTAMHILSEENLIGSDATILAFVRDADRQRCRLIVSGHEISGLVSLSDLQRLPVRAALFGLVTYLEILMMNVIRLEFNGTEGWLECLSEGRRQKLRAEISNAQVGDGLVDALLFTQFADKKALIRRSPRLELGKEQFERELNKIEALRNHLAHANDYASSPQAAAETCETVRLIDKWNTKFSRWLL